MASRRAWSKGATPSYAIRSVFGSPSRQSAHPTPRAQPLYIGEGGIYIGARQLRLRTPDQPVAIGCTFGEPLWIMGWTTTEWLVIAGAMALIGWVNWYFLLGSRASERAERDGT